MKIVIDIPEETYGLICNLPYLDVCCKEYLVLLAIKNGTPLPKGHGRLIDADKLIKDNGLDKATKYGNETKGELLFSYGTMMMYEIFDLIDDAEVIVEADKDGKCPRYKEGAEE